jgi:hypothetical protein
LTDLAPAGIGLLNLWNDFRKVVRFVDENPWVKPMLEKIERHKKYLNVYKNNDELY